MRRLKVLGFTIEDEPIQRAVACMEACLRGERKIDDYWEKTHDWELFTKLILSAWIKIFEPDNAEALLFARRWGGIIESAFEGGKYNHKSYIDAYICEFSSIPKGAREIDFADFYHMHLLQNVLSEKIERLLLDYILKKGNGIYYVYDKSLNILPAVWAMKETSRYLSAILEKFIAKQKVSFICSIDENGFPNMKAMLKPRKRNGIREFYFSTNTSSMRVKQFRNNPNASIYFYDKGLIKYTGVMLIGKMEVLTDQKIKSELWERGDTMFYKKGVTDPDYCVLKFTTQRGRYYCDLKTESFEL